MCPCEPISELNPRCRNQVPLEAVLSDAVGLHLNAGPFFLIYSRALSPEEENEKPSWPDTLKVGLVTVEFAEHVADSSVDETELG